MIKPAAALLCLALTGCADHFANAGNMIGMECAPNGTCWPENYERMKPARVFRVDDPAAYCERGLKATGWGNYLANKRILACTIGKELPSQLVYLPKTLPAWAGPRGWSLAMLERYELANVEGVAVYPVGTPARLTRKPAR